MMDESPTKSATVERFWNAFQSCVEENRVAPGRSTHYVRWAQAFVNVLPEKRLRDRSKQDIEGFLAELSTHPGITAWQVRQAEHALRILYETFLPAYSSGKNRKAGQEGNKPAIEASGQPDAFRDRVIPGEVERLYLPLIQRHQG
jgi:hypothetical protein